jgi:homoserine dehydrogenase
MTSFNIGMYGGGTVGGGVYELIMKNSPSNCMKITKICVRDLTKARDFQIDESITSFTDNVDSILEDDSINCIVEVMGGTGLAKRVIETALAKGKAVVTANKALLAEHWIPLQTVLKENPKAKLAWEAAVCGGIPIIQILQTAYTQGDDIQSVMGICNGTTNFMLTQMFQNGAAYGDVLQEAQDLGYAEADPTADVEGHDVRAKIALLAQLAYGGSIEGAVDQIPCKGISKITGDDFGYARLLKGTIKLIGAARRMDGGNKVSVYVTPALVKEDHALASIHGAGNAVVVDSKNLGACAYTGPGAGRYPTANSVVADLYRLVSAPAAAPAADAPLVLDSNYAGSFYIRVPVAKTHAGIVGKTGVLAEQHGVGIRSILKQTTSDKDFCITTEECSVRQVEGFCADLAKQDFSGEPPLFMPILS